MSNGRRGNRLFEKTAELKQLSDALMFLCLFAIVSWLMATGKTEGLDESVRLAAYSMRQSWLNPIMIGITYLASPPFIIGAILLLLIVPMTRKQIGLPLAVYQLLTYGVYKLMKAGFARPRPDAAMWLVQEKGFAFPSGHAMNGLIFWWMLVYLIRKTYKGKWVDAVTVIFTILPFIIALTRIYVGVHWLTDILAGLCMGIACVTFARVVMDTVVYDKYKYDYGNNKTDSGDDAGTGTAN